MMNFARKFDGRSDCVAREFFCGYHSYLQTMEPLNDAERGRLFTACLMYSETGALLELRGNERFVFPGIRAQIDRDAKKHAEFIKKQTDNGKLGGRPKEKTQETHGFSGKPKKAKEKVNEDWDKDPADVLHVLFENSISDDVRYGNSFQLDAWVKQLLEHNLSPKTIENPIRDGEYLEVFGIMGVGSEYADRYYSDETYGFYQQYWDVPTFVWEVLPD